MKKIVLVAMAIMLFAIPVSATPYPMDMRISDDYRTLKKVYEFEYGADDVDIPTSSFSLNGYKYSFVDFIREDVKEEQKYWAIEPVEFYSKTSDINSILAQLDKEITVNYDNGFGGVIPLNLTSINVKSLGTGTSTKNVSQTRTYPNLASADMTNIPKTDGNLTLTNVQWQSDNTQTVDHYALTDRYSCVATYSGTSTTSYSKGYTVYADYQGELRQDVATKVRWTAMYSGQKQFNYWWLSLGAIPIAGVACYLIPKPKKKGRKKNEENYLD